MGKMRCPDCEGGGDIQVGDGYGIPEYDICETCEGDGWVLEREEDDFEEALREAARRD